MGRGASAYESSRRCSTARGAGPTCSWSRICTGPTRRRSTCAAPREKGRAARCARWHLRDDELDREHPLRTRAGSDRDEAGRGRASVAPLSRSAVTILRRLGGVDPEELHRKTSGNAFFVTEDAGRGGGPSRTPSRRGSRPRRRDSTPPAESGARCCRGRPARAEPWLLDALVGESIDGLDECVARGCCYGRTTESRSDTSSPASRSRARSSRSGGSPSIGTTLGARGEPPGERSRTWLASRMHAGAAGDVDAVIEVRARRGSTRVGAGAHREAATLFARALRYRVTSSSRRAGRAPPQARDECYLTDRADEAMRHSRARCLLPRAWDRLARATRCARSRRSSGARAGDVRHDHRRRGASRSSSSFRPDPSSARAYTDQAFLSMRRVDREAAESGARRAFELAMRSTIADVCGAALPLRLRPSATAELAERGRGGASRATQLALALGGRRAPIVRRRRPRLRARPSRTATSTATTCFGCTFWPARPYAISNEGVGRRRRAATLVLGERAVSTLPRTVARVVLALVRARRGDPDVLPLTRRGVSPRGPDAESSARWHRSPRPEPRPRGCRETSERSATPPTPLEIAVRVGGSPEPLGLEARAGSSTSAGCLRRSRTRWSSPGNHTCGRSRWAELGRPYEAALAPRPRSSDEELDVAGRAEARRWAHRRPRRIVARRLRERGARGIPRGPRALDAGKSGQPDTTRARRARLSPTASGTPTSPSGSSSRARTVDHHVSTILRKLGDRTPRRGCRRRPDRLELLQDR